jgi:hypothetical protein
MVKVVVLKIGNLCFNIFLLIFWVEVNTK